MIEKIEAYKIGDKIFDNIDDAENYKYQKLDEVKLGETVSTNGFVGFYGGIGFQGRVSIMVKYFMYKQEENRENLKLL